MTTAELLSESQEGVRRREESELGRMLAQTSGEVVLFGAGSLGRKTAAALRSHGIEPVAFADNDTKIQGSSVDGLRVIAPQQAAERWAKRALFVVSTFLPGSGVQHRVRELVELGCTHVTSFLVVGWRHSGILPHFGADLPSRLLAHKGELARSAALWDDEASRETFRQQLAWRLRAAFDEVGCPAPNQYFPTDLICQNPQECFVDGGAYDGDTLRKAPWPFGRIIAVEPDPANASRLRAMRGAHLLLHEVLLGSATGSSRFAGIGTMASARSDDGALEVPVETLDRLLQGEEPTFIKLDVEGDELRALQGAAGVLQRTRPIVAVCVYHRPADLWELPLFLRESLPHHRLYLRAHECDGFELVAYAVPLSRCPPP
jgi:FkbM family methyltransferase